MNVLVIGGGGREHAICGKLRQSARLEKLYCAPGNGGIADIADCAPIPATDVGGILRFAKEKKIDLVVVAPDDPLALGMVDALEDSGVRAFGPRKDAAVIESSKIFSKNLMKKHGIPTADFEVFTETSAAKLYVLRKGAPIVVKADGLALGKGVVVAGTVEEALEAIDAMMLDKKFGDSGSRIVIEECMTGPEVTVLAFTDGKTLLPMLASQDHKRALTGDLGPNTGGMGAFCPSPHYTEALADECMSSIFLPTIRAMSEEGREFKGVIYFGLMLTDAGPKVVEYNARFGDPEAQPLLALLETDLLDVFDAVVDGRLEDIELRWRPGFACCVVLASGGYPGDYGKGYEITGLGEVPGDVSVHHAGTSRTEVGYVTNGGRVLGVTATGGTLGDASARAYEGAGMIRFKGAYYRADIGKLPPP